MTFSNSQFLFLRHSVCLCVCLFLSFSISFSDPPFLPLSFSFPPSPSCSRSSVIPSCCTSNRLAPSEFSSSDSALFTLLLSQHQFYLSFHHVLIVYILSFYGLFLTPILSSVPSTIDWSGVSLTPPWCNGLVFSRFFAPSIPIFMKQWDRKRRVREKKGMIGLESHGGQDSVIARSGV